MAQLPTGSGFEVLVGQESQGPRTTGLVGGGGYDYYYLSQLEGGAHDY